MPHSGASARASMVPPSPAAPPAGGGGSTGGALDAAELERRRQLYIRANPSSPEARELAAQGAHGHAARNLAAIRAQVARIQELEDAEREKLRPRGARAPLANDFDPGAPKAAWARESTHASSSASRGLQTQRDRELARAIAGEEKNASSAGHDSANTRPLTDDGTGAPPCSVDTIAPTEQAPAGDKRRRRRRLRPWKAPRRKPVEASERALQFGRDRAWTKERSQRLAVIIKKNNATIAHPRAAEAAYNKLPPWRQAAIRRAMRAKGWTFGDEAARRHIAFWHSLEELSVVHPWSRPRRFQRKSGMWRYAGRSKYAFACVGWTQPALALAMSGAACHDAGNDPIDTKTVKRHADLAAEHGGLQVVVRNPEAPPELRGRATESNPRGWPINVYWLPDPQLSKPGFAGAWWDADGNPIGLEESLALELTPRTKRPRRLRELRELAQRPPPTVS